MPLLELTPDQADVMRAALANYADRMQQAYSMFQHLDYAAQVELCEDLIEQLNKAEGRTDDTI